MKKIAVRGREIRKDLFLEARKGFYKNSRGGRYFENGYSHIVKQIEREDNLLNKRLALTYQLNGFIFAALALFSSESFQVKIFSHLFLPVIGLVISVSGLFGSFAAIMQMYYLRGIWYKIYETRTIRPFGSEFHCLFGKFWMFVPCLILTGMWVFLFVIDYRTDFFWVAYLKSVMLNRFN